MKRAAGTSAVAATQVTVDSPVGELRGIGPVTAAALAALGVDSVGRLLLHGPLRYQDRSSVTPLAELVVPDCWVTVRGTVVRSRLARTRRRGMSVVEAELSDPSGQATVVWFNQRSLPAALAPGTELRLYGMVRTLKNGRVQLVNPDIERWSGEEGSGVVPVYGSLGPLAGKRLRSVLAAALPALASLEDPLPEDLRRRLDLVELGPALAAAHQPPSPAAAGERLTRARARLAFDEALAFHCAVEEQAAAMRRLVAPSCRVDDSTRAAARRLLPFRLTPGQRRAAAEIAADLQRPVPMARLLQGDVGSGKTVVAALATLIVVSSGHQAALMAPTEILAEQHFVTLRALFAATGSEVALLTSGLAPARRREVLAAVAAGEVDLVIGTHALIQEGVRFARLGLVVVDEQHRFGVRHRQRLVAKGRAPHLLVMTATPIPRSLALTSFGDLEVSVVDGLPPGRQPVRTEVRDGAARDAVLTFLAGEVAAGGRAYVVFPLIEPSEKLAARALTEHADELRARLPGVVTALVHGRLARAEREAALTAFRSGQVQVLLATSVVEVGVDVPEATVMVVESAERFGLAQLHQLRGRVGRGRRRSWCILLTGPDARPDSRQRLEELARTASGFDVAEADLRQRGAGELAGTRQWGVGHFRFLDLANDVEVLVAARAAARELAAAGQLQAVQRGLARFHRTELEIAVG